MSFWKEFSSGMKAMAIDFSRAIGPFGTALILLSLFVVAGLTMAQWAVHFMQQAP